METDVQTCFVSHDPTLLIFGTFSGSTVENIDEAKMFGNSRTVLNVF